MAKRVLIAESAPFMRMLISNIFKKNGYEVVGEALNGEEAVEKYMELKPDIMTMDTVMPGLDGMEALKAIKEKDPAAVVVMCSSQGQQSMVIEALKSGAKEFIVKPFEPGTFLRKIEEALK